MITYVDGYLLQAPAQTLVNTVNTVGVMGKGVAREFKAAFPEMFAEYRRICELGKLRVGQLWLYRSPHKWILNFPTKTEWRRPSKLEYVELGLSKFVETYAQQGVTSAAFPALGCGNGGLDWADVKRLMEQYLGKLSIPILIYPHRNTAQMPEHETPREIALWLRSEPESLSFHEFWADITEILTTSRTFAANSQPYTLSLEQEGVRVQNKESLLVEKDEMMDLWQQLRRQGFASDGLTPTSLEDRVCYLLPLVAELPYVRRVRVGRQYRDITGDHGYGVQFLPRVSTSRAPAPRVQPTVGAPDQHEAQVPLPL